MTTVVLKDLLSGETSGGTFVLTNVTNYPTSFIDIGSGNTITISSSADLPRIMSDTSPSYDTILNMTNARGGVYTFEYCVSGCTNACTSVDLTIIEKPILGVNPSITRCGVNGVYGSVSACFSGGITRFSDSAPYTEELMSLTWTKGAWTATGNCVSIPNTVTPGAITVRATTADGTCYGETTVTLIQSNVYAGNPRVNPIKLCLDKHQIEVYKNTPGGGVDIARVRLDTDLSYPYSPGLFTGNGEVIPPGAIKTWTQISGPSVVPLVTSDVADFKNALIGNYTFRRTVTLGSCSHYQDYNIIVKFCTLGNQVSKVNTYCKHNVTFTMINEYVSLFNPDYNPISTGGCWIYLGSNGPDLDIEINGTVYTNYTTGSRFPYNAIVRITSQGTYDFEFDDAAGGSNPGGCVAASPYDVCDCDYFATFNSSGTFVIDTNTGAPLAGVSKFYAIGCGTRQVSLFSKFNELNGGTVTAGGVWTYEAVQLPITFKVDGVNTTFTSYGQVVPGTDPLVDLTGLPNPLNVQFKYTVTNACGTANKNFTINITCNECTKTIDTTVTTTDCISNLSIVKPVSFTPNMYSLVTTNNQKEVTGKVLARVTDCDGAIVDTPINARGNTLVYGIKIGNFVTGAYEYPKGSYLKTLTLENNSGVVKTLNLDPYSTPYLTGCTGGLAISPIDLCYSHETRFVYAAKLKKLLQNAICAEFSGAVIGTNYDLKQIVVNTNLGFNNGFVHIEFYAKHNPTGQWISLNTTTANATWSRGVNTCPSPNNHQTEFNVAKYEIPSEIDWNAACTNYCGSFNKFITGYGIPGIINVGTSTPFSINLNLTETPVVDVAYPQEVTSLTCKKWTFNTTISPACTGSAIYSYKVGGSAIPETTASFIKKTKAIECNPFNTNANQLFETTVVCDGCTYTKTPLIFCS